MITEIHSKAGVTGWPRLRAILLVFALFAWSCPYLYAQDDQDNFPTPIQPAPLSGYHNFNWQFKVFVKLSIDAPEPYGQTNYNGEDNSFLLVGKIFRLIPQEALAGIPVCLELSLHGSEYSFDLTDPSGTARIGISQNAISLAGEDTSRWRMIANPRPELTQFARNHFRGDLTTSSHSFGAQLASAVSSKKWSLIIPCHLYYAGDLLRAWENVHSLIERMPSLNHEEATSKISDIVGSRTALAQRYPRSCMLIRERLRRLYSCDSMIEKSSKVNNGATQLRYLRSLAARTSPDDPCYDEIAANIQRVQTSLKSKREEDRYERMEAEDKEAMKRFRVDKTITQVDLFKNPFAFEGQCMLMTCAVYKFETPTSAIMEGAERFYAHFKVTPPKKFSVLYLIIRVKGVTTLVNAFGTPIKVPLVDVVHILNLPPDDNSGEN